MVKENSTLDIERNKGDFFYPETHTHDAGIGLSEKTIHYISDVKDAPSAREHGFCRDLTGWQNCFEWVNAAFVLTHHTGGLARKDPRLRRCVTGGRNR